MVMLKHGHAVRGKRTRTHRICALMRFRALSPKADCARNYSERGIGCCDRWDVYANFLADMGEAPAGKTLDRIDNDKGYSPNNCRWATKAEQVRNTRRNHYVQFGDACRTVTDWAAYLGISPFTLFARFRNGWSIEKALTTSVKSKSSNGRMSHVWRLVRA
jgi:hypothetical protein